MVILSILGASFAEARIMPCKPTSFPKKFTIVRQSDADPSVIDSFQIKTDDFNLGTIAVRKMGASKSFALKDEERNQLATAIATSSKNKMSLEVFDCPGNKLGSIIENNVGLKNSKISLLDSEGKRVSSRRKAFLDPRVKLMLSAYRMSENKKLRL
jgi:hypothetical protein